MTDTADPDDDFGLPAWVYSNPRFFAAERDRILAPSWQVVCHLNDIPRPGDFHTFEFLGESVVVVRGHDGSAMSACTAARRWSTIRPVDVVALSVPTMPGPMIS